MDDLAVVGVGGKSVALRDLARQIAVLHVLVGLGDGAPVEGVALVHAGDDQAGGPVRREHHLDVRDLALADALQLPLVPELDLDRGAGLELVLPRPLAADVRQVDPKAARLVHVVGDADAEHGALQLWIGGGPVHDELEIGDEALLVGQGRDSAPLAKGADEGLP